MNEVREFLPAVDMDFPDYSDEFRAFATTVMQNAGKNMPRNATEAIDLYVFLLQKTDEHTL